LKESCVEPSFVIVAAFAVRDMLVEFEVEAWATGMKPNV